MSGRWTRPLKSTSAYHCLTVYLFHLEREVASHVFISYARTNQPYAQDLAKFLKDHGIPVWYDYQLEAGEIFWKTIQDNIDDSVAMLVVVTPAAAESKGGVWREVSYATKKDKQIFPLLLESTDTMILLDDLQRQDVTGNKMPSEALYRRLRGLAAADAIRRRTIDFPQVGVPVGEMATRKTPRTPYHGYFQTHSKGAVAWTPFGGAQPIWGAIAKYYEGHRFRDKAIGYPVGSEVGIASPTTQTAGVYQRFEGSERYPEDVTEKLRARNLDQSAQRKPGASIYWSARFGAHATYGGIGLKYERLDSIWGEMGFPKSDEIGIESPDGGWQCYQEFENGAIFWTNAGGRAIPVANAIWGHLRANSDVRVRLGCPIGSADITGNRSEQVFQNGIVISRGGVPEVWWK